MARRMVFHTAAADATGLDTHESRFFAFRLSYPAFFQQGGRWVYIRRRYRAIRDNYPYVSRAWYGDGVCRSLPGRRRRRFRYHESRKDSPLAFPRQSRREKASRLRAASACGVRQCRLKGRRRARGLFVFPPLHTEYTCVFPMESILEAWIPIMAMEAAATSAPWSRRGGGYRTITARAHGFSLL